MKKLLAILLAALMALTGAMALAEGGDALDEPAGFPGLTLTSAFDVDHEVLAEVLAAVGAPEEIDGIADSVASVLSEAGERLIIAGDGAEYALTLKGKDIVNLVGQANDSGINLASNLVPNYVLSMSYETLGQIAEQLSEQLGALEGVDVDAVVEALTGYFEQFIESAVAAVAMGDPETGEFDVNGLSFNTRVPVDVDMAAIAEAARTLAKQLSEDETLQAATQALQAAGADVTVSDIEETTDEALPRLEMRAYMNVDEAGDTDGVVDVTFTVYAPESDEAATIGDVLAQEDAVTVNLDFVTADSQLTFAYAPIENGNEIRLDVDAQGVYVGIDAHNVIGEESLTLDADLFVLNREKPLLSEHCEIALEGALTLSADAEGKNVLTVEELMGEGSDEAVGSLVSDLTGNGLGGVISAALEAMPEEIGSLATLFMGGADAAA